MITLRKNTHVRFSLDNVITKNAPEKWDGMEVLATFDNGAVQANISMSEFLFVLDEAKFIRKHVQDGKTGGPGIHHGIPLKIEAFNTDVSLTTFNGFLDLTDNYQELEDGSVKCNIVRENGLGPLEDKLSRLTYGYLKEIGVVTESDYLKIPYVEEKRINLFEILVANIMLFLLIKELAESVQKTAYIITEAASLVVIGFGTGAIGAAILSVAKAIIQVIYTALILAAVINLGLKLINTFIPQVREHKVIKLRRALEIVANHLGYNFVAPTISELDFLYYLPSNTNLDEPSKLFGIIETFNGTPVGIPHSQDYGYGCAEMFKLAKDLFYGKYAIIGNDLHLRPENDPFWEQQSTYVFPDKLIPVTKYNAGDLKGRRVLSFDTDPKDQYTIDNLKGTFFETVTDAITTPNVKAKFIKGVEETKFLVSLGNSKTELNALENTVKSVASFFDSVINALGGSSNLADKIKNKIGMLKVSDNDHSKPKLLYLVGTRLPSNHREKFSSKVLEQKYHKEKSHVQDNFRGQKIVFDEITDVPFGVESYLQLIDNNSFTTTDGRQGKVTFIKWLTAQDHATMSFWIREKYDANLKETFIEAE